MAADGDPRRVICERCGARAWLGAREEAACADCGGSFRSMAFLEGLVDRWFAPADQRVSELYPRHLKLIELLWTGQGRGRDTYEALAPEKVSYSQFVPRATQVVLKGLREGWIAVSIPPAPTFDDTAYTITFLEPDRWADELARAFEPPAARQELRGRPDAEPEGDPDFA